MWGLPVCRLLNGCSARVGWSNGFYFLVFTQFLMIVSLPRSASATKQILCRYDSGLPVVTGESLSLSYLRILLVLCTKVYNLWRSYLTREILPAYVSTMNRLTYVITARSSRFLLVASFHSNSRALPKIIIILETKMNEIYLAFYLLTTLLSLTLTMQLCDVFSPGFPVILSLPLPPLSQTHTSQERC